MGDDKPVDCAEEGVSVDLLSCMLEEDSPPSISYKYHLANFSPFRNVCVLSTTFISRYPPYQRPPRGSPQSNAPLFSETKNTYHRPDPSFTYLLSLFMFLTGLAWGIAYTPNFGTSIRLSLIFTFIHFLLGSLLFATGAYFLVGRLLGPGIAGLPGRRRVQGLFTPEGEREKVEFGYCFDVSRRGVRRLSSKISLLLHLVRTGRNVGICEGFYVLFLNSEPKSLLTWLSTNNLGSDPSVLPILGVGVCLSILALAIDITEILVRPKSPSFSFLIFHTPSLPFNYNSPSTTHNPGTRL